MKLSNIGIVVMLALGVLTFAILVALYNGSLNNFYFEMILEIAAWVFIWKAVEILFLQRPKIRRKYIQMQKLCSAEIKIINPIKKEKLNVEEKRNSKSKR